MALLYGAHFEAQGSGSGIPHILGFLTTRTVADDGLFEVRKGSAVGTRVFRLTMEGQLQVEDGTAAKPSYGFKSDKDLGLYFIGANNLGMSINGTLLVSYEVALLNVTGGIRASTSVTAGSTMVLSSGTLTDTTGAISFGNENLTTLGTLSAGAVSITTPNTVAGTGLMVTSNASSVQEIMRDSSSARFKEDIEDAVIDVRAVLAINSKRYGRKGSVGSYLGFIVEDFHAAGFGDILAYDDVGPAGFLEFGRGVTALHHAVLQSQDERIETNEQKIKRLESEVRELKKAA